MFEDTTFRDSFIIHLFILFILFFVSYFLINYNFCLICSREKLLYGGDIQLFQKTKVLIYERKKMKLKKKKKNPLLPYIQIDAIDKQSSYEEKVEGKSCD